MPHDQESDRTLQKRCVVRFELEKQPIDAGAGEDKKTVVSWRRWTTRVQTIDQGRELVVMCTPWVVPLVRPRAGRENVAAIDYEVAAKQLVMDMCNGFNSSIIMYGQTGSGKTWTCWRKQSAANTKANSDRGLVEWSCEEVLSSPGREACSSRLYVSRRSLRERGERLAS